MSRLRGGPAALAALAGALLAGCAQIPGSGAVQVERAVPGLAVAQEPDIRLLPPPPVPGESPVQVVAGFLNAQGNDQDNHGIARLFLTGAAAAAWRDRAATVVYDAGTLTLAQTGPATVTASAQQVGSLDRHGVYTPADRPWREEFSVVRVDGQWRLSAVPAGVELSQRDLQRAYRVEQLYFLSRAGHLLVPESVYLPASRSALPTELFRALLRGPDPWLAPAVVSDIPAGTQLSGSVVQTGAQVSADLGIAPSAVGASALPGVLEQVAATLGQLPGTAAVRLTADGQPLTLSGGSPGVVSTTAGSPADPDARQVGPARTSPVADATALAVSPDGSRLAAVVPGPRGASLLLVDAAGDPHAVDLGAEPTSVSFLPDGNLLVATSVGLAMVSPAGHVAQVAGAPAARVVAVARDGVRVALVTTGGAADLGVLVAPAGGQGWRLAVLRPLAPELTRVVALAWAGELEVEALGAQGGGPEQLWQLAPDGTGLLAQAVHPPLPAAPTWLAAAPGRATLLGVGDQVWRVTSAGVALAGTGRLPSYPA